MAKLEWNRTTMGEWQSKPIGQTWWRIWVNDDGEFVCGMYTFPNLGAAKEHCEKLQAEKKDAAAPAELPTVGEVWGVPGKPEKWRHVHRHHDDGDIGYEEFGDTSWDTPKNWQSWVRESGAVRIDGEAERVKELEAEAEKREKRMEAFHERALTAEMARDNAQAAVGRLLAALRGIENYVTSAIKDVPIDALWEIQHMAREALEPVTPP